MKLAVTGTTGLIGSRFKDLLGDEFEIVGINSSEGIDIRDKTSLYKFLDNINPDIIIHFAGKTNVDSCEEDKEKDLNKMADLSILEGNSISIDKINYSDWKKDNTAFAINTIGTKNLVDYANDRRVKFIYISTDFVFNGTNDYYTEEDKPDAINWYGMTKYYGEEIIQQKLENFLIVRLAFPYGYYNDKKKDFVWKLYDLIENEKDLSLVEDQYITPTFIDDVVFGLKFLIEKDQNGIFHLVGESYVSPYEIGNLISTVLLNEQRNFKKIKKEELYKGRATRPFKVRLKNDKLEKLGFKTRTFEEGLKAIKEKI